MRYWLNLLKTNKFFTRPIQSISKICICVIVAVDTASCKPLTAVKNLTIDT